MKNMLILSLLILLLTPLSVFAKTFGKGVSLKETTAISAILDQPERYVGKTVQVRGTIVEVCAKRGCWMDLAGDRPFEKLQIKVTDGEIVFPLEARGKTATVEGVIEVNELTREQVIEKRKHHAEEQGIAFEPKSVTKGEKSIRIRGLGAEISGI